MAGRGKQRRGDRPCEEGAGEGGASAAGNQSGGAPTAWETRRVTRSERVGEREQTGCEGGGRRRAAGVWRARARGAVAAVAESGPAPEREETGRDGTGRNGKAGRHLAKSGERAPCPSSSARESGRAGKAWQRDKVRRGGGRAWRRRATTEASTARNFKVNSFRGEGTAHESRREKGAGARWSRSRARTVSSRGLFERRR